MRITLRPIATLLIIVAAAAGCGAPVTSTPPPVTPAQPSPVGARIVTETLAPPPPDTSCVDATASLRPDGPLPPPLQMPPGSTMDAIVQRGHLIVGVDQNTYLFGYRDPHSNALSGFDVEIARQIALAIFGDPEKFQPKVMNSAQRIPALKNKEVDVVVRTFTINCERRKEIEFSTVYFESTQRVLAKKQTPPANGLADFGGKPVCAAKGSTSLTRIANFQPRPIPVEVANWTDCLVMLQQGQVEAISTDDTILAGLAEQDPNIEVVGPSLGAEPYGIGIPIDNKDMVQFVNAVLERLRADGTWTRIYRENLSILGAPPPPPQPRYLG